MEAQRLGIKVYATAPEVLRPPEFIPVLHRWIQTHRLDELMIDVADYSHVHGGPGVLLVCHAANYVLDLEDGRPGLVYQRKRSVPGNFAERLESAVRATLRACRCLEEEEAFAGRLRFGAERLRLRIHDRLLAPNTGETFAAVRPALAELCRRLYQDARYELGHTPDERALFEVAVDASGELSVAAALERLG